MVIADEMLCCAFLQGDVSRASPADSAADIHDTGAALDAAQPHLQHAGAELPAAAAADTVPSAAQQSPSAPLDSEPAQNLKQQSNAAACAGAEVEEISPAQGADFTQVTPCSTAMGTCESVCSHRSTCSRKRSRVSSFVCFVGHAVLATLHNPLPWGLPKPRPCTSTFRQLPCLCNHTTNTQLQGAGR